jgi:hypothetical protein
LIIFLMILLWKNKKMIIKSSALNVDILLYYNKIYGTE